jgi:CBS domain containing-hemolysin-like protein
MSLFEILTYILIFVLLSLSAIFSASETAFAVSNSMRLSKAAASGRKSAKLAEYIDKNFVRSISTILVGNNLVNIAASSAFTVLFISYFGNNKGTVLAMIVSTVVILIFGEIMPKIIANEYADSLVYILAYPIRFFMIVFSPVVRVVAAIVRRYEKYWTPKDNGQASVKPEELVTMLETIEEEGVITEKEKELIKSAIEFPDVTARDIFTPRVDVAAFDIEDGIEHIFDNEELLSYSRFPVYRENLDNIIGIMPTKILLKTAISNPDADLLSLLTPPIYVHMTRTISSILLEFRKTHTHMAVVVDEFGGMMGIITIEDILEEIFGEIYDESDGEEEIPVKTETV